MRNSLPVDAGSDSWLARALRGADLSAPEDPYLVRDPFVLRVGDAVRCAFEGLLTPKEDAAWSRGRFPWCAAKTEYAIACRVDDDGKLSYVMRPHRKGLRDKWQAPHGAWALSISCLWLGQTAESIDRRRHAVSALLGLVTVELRRSQGRGRSVARAGDTWHPGIEGGWLQDLLRNPPVGIADSALRFAERLLAHPEDALRREIEEEWLALGGASLEAEAKPAASLVSDNRPSPEEIALAYLTKDIKAGIPIRSQSNYAVRAGVKRQSARRWTSFLATYRQAKADEKTGSPRRRRRDRRTGRDDAEE